MQQQALASKIVTQEQEQSNQPSRIQARAQFLAQPKPSDNQKPQVQVGKLSDRHKLFEPKQAEPVKKTIQVNIESGVSQRRNLFENRKEETQEKQQNPIQSTGVNIQERIRKLQSDNSKEQQQRQEPQNIGSIKDRAQFLQHSKSGGAQKKTIDELKDFSIQQARNSIQSSQKEVVKNYNPNDLQISIEERKNQLQSSQKAQVKLINPFEAKVSVKDIANKLGQANQQDKPQKQIETGVRISDKTNLLFQQKEQIKQQVELPSQSLDEIKLQFQPVQQEVQSVKTLETQSQQEGQIDSDNKIMLSRPIMASRPIQAAPILAPFTPNSIYDNPGARRKAKRVGRGPGSGKGKTCGKGHKGSKARGTNKGPAFEGGQTPITKRIPKWGKSLFKYKPLDNLKLGDLAYFIRKERFDLSKPITIRDMFEAGVFSNVVYGIRLLPDGAEKLNFLQQPLNIEVSEATKEAIDAVNEKGGSVTCVYRTKIQMRYHLKPYKYDLPMRDTAMPAPYEAIRMEKLREMGAKVVYVRPSWLDDYKPIVVPEIPKHTKREKIVAVRHIKYTEK